MNDVLDGVREHYRATGLTERLKAALAAHGPDHQRLTPGQLAGLDQFLVHARSSSGSYLTCGRADCPSCRRGA